MEEATLKRRICRSLKILSEAVEATNCSKVANLDDLENEKFGHRKKSAVAGQKGSLLPSRPIWLCSSIDTLQIIYNKDIIGKVKNQLEVLEQVVARGKSSELVQEVSNGQIQKLSA